MPTSVSKAETRIRRNLALALILNLGLSAALAITGVVADSSGLIANAVDNCSDAAVYGLSLFAIGRSSRRKVLAARVSGVFLLLFAAGVLADAVRRALMGSEPIGPAMMAMALISAVVNLTCLWLLKRLDTDDVNLKAAQTFSFNDFISNGGILVAGGLVLLLGQRWPDLVVGGAVALVALWGGIGILKEAKEAAKAAKVRSA